MTVGWCLQRTELVFKCLKGFLMEICATGSSSVAGCGSSGLFNSSTTAHYNINFVLPSKISQTLFNQIVEMFSTTFHLIPSLSA